MTHLKENADTNNNITPDQEFFRKFVHDARLIIYSLELGRDDVISTLVAPRIPTTQELVRFSLKRIYQDTSNLSANPSIEAGRSAIYKYITGEQSQYTEEEKKFMEWLIKRIESDTPPFFQDVGVLISKFWQKIRNILKNKF
ncbi:hypothetical protein HZC21_03105 [Candidatus Peregrinibacteria bacterium]|nr:hypothetical protein [Candidatus Peregrinibacteria bacterium]